MKLQIDKKDLLGIISRAQHIVEKRNTMPVLMNVLLETQDNALRVFATDLEVSLTDDAQCQVLESGKVAVSAKSLFEIIKELPDGMVTLEKKENNWLKISQLKSVFNIVGISPDEYPVFPTFNTTEFTKLDSRVLTEMIEKTIYSVSNDETRYHLNGVFFSKSTEGENVVYRMVATDGHRLSLVDRKSNGSQSQQGMADTQGVIIPRKGLNEIKKILDNVEDSVDMAIEGSQLIVKNSNTILMIRLIEGKYPNYQQLIPQNMKENMVVNREALLSSLKRVSLLSNSKSKGVTLNLAGNRLEISSNNPELGDAKEEIEVDYSGQDMKIGFNAKYILDVLGSMTDEAIQLELNDQLSPGLVRPHKDSSYTCVVMPMRI
ncbi:MAG: DNA polymerase III subunit beta [Bdellovibrionales bacterium]|nr:DNA polymerase III subunit beta [Bdellovibrionales bacterium]